MEPSSGSALAARYSACCKARTCRLRQSPAVDLAVTALTGPLPAARARTKQRPFPHRRLCCPPGSIGTTTASDSLPARRPLPGSTPVIGRAVRRQLRSALRPGRASPVPAATLSNVPRPLTPGSPSRLRFQALHRFHGLRREPPGSALPCMSNDAAGFAYATDRSVASPNRAFDAGLRPDPFPDQSRQPATGPPGSYPDRTHTGRRRRASDQVMTAGRSPPDHWAHRLEY